MALTQGYVKKNKPGSTIVLKYKLLSSDVVQAGLQLTNATTNDMYIQNVILKTDSTGLATGTNCVVYSNNTYGLANIISTAVSGLNGNKTIDISTASVTKQPTVLEAGKYISIGSTTADCTGAGVLYVYIVCVPISDIADIS